MISDYGPDNSDSFEFDDFIAHVGSIIDGRLAFCVQAPAVCAT